MNKVETTFSESPDDPPDDPPHSPGYLELGLTPSGHALAGEPSLNIEVPIMFPPGP